MEQDFHEGQVWSFGYWTRENLGERERERERERMVQDSLVCRREEKSALTSRVNGIIFEFKHQLGQDMCHSLVLTCCSLERFPPI